MGSLPSCKSWWYNYTQETAKNGLKQETAMKPAISLHTTKIIRGNEGQEVLYIPSDLPFYFLSTIFHFQPSVLSHNCTHSSSGLGNFLLNFLQNIPHLKCVGPTWASWYEFHRKRRPQKSLIPTTQHIHTQQKEIWKFLTAELHLTRK